MEEQPKYYDIEYQTSLEQAWILCKQRNTAALLSYQTKCRQIKKSYNKPSHQSWLLYSKTNPNSYLECQHLCQQAKNTYTVEYNDSWDTYNTASKIALDKRNSTAELEMDKCDALAKSIKENIESSLCPNCNAAIKNLNNLHRYYKCAICNNIIWLSGNDDMCPMCEELIDTLFESPISFNCPDCDHLILDDTESISLLLEYGYLDHSLCESTDKDENINE